MPRNTKESVAEFMARAGKSVPAERLPPIRATSLDDNGSRGRTLHERLDASAVGPARPPRVSKKDAPEFDEELGLIPEWDEPADREPSDAETAEWNRLARDVVARLGQLSAFREFMPIASIPAKADVRINARTLRALPALIALHEVLCPGWREIVRNWFELRALARIEGRQRALREGGRSRGRRVNIMPARSPGTGQELLETLRRNPPDLMGPIPVGLTGELLEFLAQTVNRRPGGRNGGHTPEKALALAQEWAAEPDGFKAALAAVQKAVRERRRRRLRK